MTLRRIALISTGGTIEKTYDPFDGALQNRFSVLDAMLATLQIPNTELVRVPLLNKDSLEMDAKDHRLIATTAHAMAEAHDGVIIVHGTDRLEHSGNAIWELSATPPVPIVLTGAMRPYELRDTDAIQNVTEALLAAKFLPGGVYAVLHNEVHRFPGVRKDRQAGRFMSAPDPAPKAGAPS